MLIMKREHLSAILGFITGHNSQLKYMVRIGAATSYNSEKKYHFLGQCYALPIKRSKILGSFFFQTLTEPRDENLVKLWQL